VLLYIQH